MVVAENVAQDNAEERVVACFLSVGRTCAVDVELRDSLDRTVRSNLSMCDTQMVVRVVVLEGSDFHNAPLKNSSRRDWIPRVLYIPL